MSNHLWALVARPHLSSPFPLGVGGDGRQASAPGLRGDGSVGIMSSGPAPPVRLPGSTPSLLQFDAKQKQAHRLRKQTYTYQRGKVVVVTVQSLSHVQHFETPWAAARQASLSFTISWSLLKFKSIESVMPSNHLILCCPLLFLPSVFPRIRVFSNESVLRIRWPKYWSFSFSISPSNEYSVLISFRTDWFDLLAVQGTLKSLLQYHSSEVSIVWHSAFFMVQLSHPYITSGKTIALTRWTFVGKVMCLLFNMLSRLVLNFLPRNVCLSFVAVVMKGGRER